MNNFVGQMLLGWAKREVWLSAPLNRLLTELELKGQKMNLLCHKERSMSDASVGRDNMLKLAEITEMHDLL